MTGSTDPRANGPDGPDATRASDGIDDVDPADAITADDLAAASAASTDEDDEDDEPGSRAAVLSALRAAFGALARSGEADLLDAEGEDRTDVAVAGEDWTLYVTGWPGPRVAFVAIEDEPAEDASPAAVETAWREAIPDEALTAMVEADRALVGALSAAMDGSGDALSASIAAAVRALTDAT